MHTPICCTDCTELGIFADELKRLANAGLVAAQHSDIQRLKSGEFTVDMPMGENSSGCIHVYYRE
ncbi:MAG: hypothetical protein V7739_01255 [Motiliproteus sp.]